MPIQMQCPHCQAVAALPDGHAGRPVRCKRCGAKFASPPDAGAEPGQPAVIDRYLVRELLGQGSFGSVYRAFDPRLERDVALKVLRTEMMTSAQAVERFLREAKAAAKLLHPHIVPVHDAGRSGAVYYIASAFIKGMTLASAIPEEGGMEPRRAASRGPSGGRLAPPMEIRKDPPPASFTIPDACAGRVPIPKHLFRSAVPCRTSFDADGRS